MARTTHLIEPLRDACSGSHAYPEEGWGIRILVIQSSDTSTPFSTVVGRVLRQVRMGRQLSLRQVTVRSGGRFKPSSVASYERGERQISLDRFFALSEVYGVAPERLVAAIAHRLESERESSTSEAEAEPVVVLDPFPATNRPR